MKPESMSKEFTIKQAWDYFGGKQQTLKITPSPTHPGEMFLVQPHDPEIGAYFIGFACGVLVGLALILFAMVIA